MSDPPAPVVVTKSGRESKPTAKAADALSAGRKSKDKTVEEIQSHVAGRSIAGDAANTVLDAARGVHYSMLVLLRLAGLIVFERLC